MFPVAPFVIYFGFFLFAIIGLIVGALSGVLGSTILKLSVNRSSIIIDAILGAIGFLITGIACALVPWPRNATVRDTVVESTMNRYQHPLIAAVIFAILLSLLHQLVRVKRLGRSVK